MTTVTSTSVPDTGRVRIFPLPDVGEGLTEADILDWKVAVGDLVAVNQILVEIETVKAAVELPSPFAGRVVELIAPLGATVLVGSPIISVDTDPEAGPLPSVAGSSAQEAAPEAAPVVDDERGSKIGEALADGRIATLVGYITPSGGNTRRPRKGAVSPVPVPDSSASVPAASPTVSPIHEEMAPAAVRGSAPLAAPPVRKLAKDLGIDLTTVTGSGPGGLIQRGDLLVPTASPAGRPDLTAGPDQAGRQRRVPVKGVRKATAAAMVASAFTAPHVTEFLAVDVTDLMALRQRLKARRDYDGVKITPLAFVARAVCSALGRTPDLNAYWDGAAGEIVYQDYVNLSIAASTPRGLMVPTIKDADAMDLRSLAVALTELTETARAGRTSPAAMTGGTFTITNIGVFGIDAGTPILNPGESGILAVGAIKLAPWVVDGELAVRQICQLALSFDHRVVDGEQGSRFLADVGAALADPALAFTW